MKRTLICIFLLAAMLVTGIAVNRHNENSVSRARADIRAVTEVGGVGTEAKLCADTAVDRWSGFCTGNIFLTNNECALEIMMSLIRIAAIAESGDGDIAEECGYAERLLSAYEDSIELSFSNIF